MDADDFTIKHFIGRAGNAADGGIQAGTVSAAGQDADSFLCLDHVKLPPY